MHVRIAAVALATLLLVPAVAATEDGTTQACTITHSFIEGTSDYADDVTSGNIVAGTISYAVFLAGWTVGSALCLLCFSCEDAGVGVRA